MEVQIINDNKVEEEGKVRKKGRERRAAKEGDENRGRDRTEVEEVSTYKYK